MPPKHSLSSLFHPKKKFPKKDGQTPTSPRKPTNSGTQSTSAGSTPTSTPRPTPPATAPNGSQPPSQSSQSQPLSQKKPIKPQASSSNVEEDEDEQELKLPEGPYQEFRLMSSALNGWKYDVMKFDSRKPIDISRWVEPIKLNRKELRRDEPSTGEGLPEAVGPMLGPDGKPVIGVDGKVVMVDLEGKPIHGPSTGGGGGGMGRGRGGGGGDRGGGGGGFGGKKRFQKKTKQVYLVPDAVRQLRREERHPWVMEDATGQELWIGQLEEVSKAATHAFFMPAANDVFKFVPAHRWYKFQKKLKHALPTDTAKVEQLYSKSQKRDPAAFLAARNGGKGPSSATAAMFKAEAEGRIVAGPSSMVHTTGTSLGPGNRRLKAVDSGFDLFGEEEDESGQRKAKERERGGEGDMDEQLYEEDFADDDDKMEPDPDDEEAKEIEERLKREYQSANKQRDGHIDESEDEDMPGVTKQEKAMQKLIRKREGNDAYDSDEEKNPYASSEEEEDEELPVVTGEPAIQQQPQQVDVRAKAEAAAKAKEEAAAAAAAVGSAPSPAASPTLGGHSVLAKRATSPKIPKPSLAKGGSPMGSRANSPAAGSRATSPVATPGPSQANGASKSGTPSTGNKRKATDDPGSGSANGAGAAPTQKKKRKPSPPADPMDEKLVIEWLKATPDATTRDCIQRFSKWINKDDESKKEFTKLVKHVATLTDGKLYLKSAYL
ncbi:Rap30/74 interaction domain-containing protein [Pluteus cervinus]|uniref:Rap30/74 interaction domain-containing protein n=1 Tax=Pluteus cervinus TaxID=181527 RepID=A0ACD3BFW0_9AGAR|nr:Rap30/74 interaction domain-containing protein [Pluteus cervinus]